MKTKIVKLQFALIVEVEDSATQEEIMEAAEQKMKDIYEDGQFASNFLNENNLISIEAAQ